MAKKTTETQGHLTLTVDRSGLEATATFTREAGHTCTLGDLFALMSDRGITEGFIPEEVGSSFRRIPYSPDPYTFTVARGQTPVPAKPETVRWTVPEVSRRLRDEAEKIVDGARPPEFDGGKGRRAPPVGPDTSVLKTREAAAAEKLGTVAGATTGVDGRDVFGQVLPAPVPADTQFHIGAGITRRQNELYSEYSGFVRIGLNWADVVPFDTRIWSLSYSADNQGLLISRDELAALVARAVEDRVRLVRSPVSASRDSDFEIEVTEDRLKAVLTLTKERGKGSALNTRQLGRAIIESRLVGLDQKRIQSDIAEFIRSSRTVLSDYVLARGTPPERGPDRTIGCPVLFLSSEETTDLRRRLARALPGIVGRQSLTTFPMDLVEDLCFVEPEQRLLSISPRVPGKSGTDVYGEKLTGVACRGSLPEGMEEWHAARASHRAPGRVRRSPPESRANVCAGLHGAPQGKRRAADLGTR
jgi:uncharacterized protein (DUF342 family)